MIFSNRKLRMIIVIILLMIFCYFIGIYKPKALTIQNAVYYKNGHSVALSGGNGSYADIAIKYYGGSQLDSVEKLSFYIEPNETEQQYKYMSGFIRFENANPSGSYIPNVPIIQLAGNTCVLEHSMSTGASYVAFTCPMAGGWIDFLNLPVSLTSFYIQRNFGVSDMINNSSTLNNINTNVNNINNSLNDSNIDDSSSSTSGFSNTTNSSMSNTPVSNLIALPITFLTGVNNAISSSCTNVNYIELFDYQLVLPCLNLSERLGNVWVIIDTIVSCMLLFSIGKSLVSTFARLSDMDTNIMYECYANGKDHRGESF